MSDERRTTGGALFFMGYEPQRVQRPVTRLLNGLLLVLEVVLIGAVFVLLTVAIALTIFFGIAWGFGGG